MATKTQTSLEALTEALTLHGWEFTRTEGPVTVKDPSRDIAPHWQSRRVLGTKQVPGVTVTFDNGVKPRNHNDLGASVHGTAVFTQNGGLVKITGPYPLDGKATSLTKTLAIVAKRSKAEHERQVEVRVERNEQSAAEAIQQADALVVEKQAEAEAAAAPALQAVMAITGLPEGIARHVLDLLVGERGHPISAFAVRLEQVNEAHRRAAYARSEYQTREANGWTW